MAEKKTGQGGKKKQRYPMGLGFKTPLPSKVEAMVRQGADVTRTPIQFIDVARFDPILFYIQHRDRKELNFRLRYYYEFHPIVHNGISLHNTFPLSDFVLQCEGTGHQNYYNDFKDEIGLLQLLMDISQDYWLLGEAFVHGKWDDFNKQWSHFMLFPPENVTMKSTYILPEPIMFLDVDDELKRLVKSQKLVDIEMQKMMDPNLVNKIAENKQILLKNWNTTHIARKTARYDLRGTSILKSCLKWLMLEDKLMLLKFTQIDRSTFPLKIFKVGNPATGWIPGKKHFENLRDLLISSSNDPDFNLIYHHGLSVEFHTMHDKIANLLPDFDLCEKRILSALFINKALLHGEGPNFANASVAMRALMSRYLLQRDLLTRWMKVKVLKPLAKARGYYKTADSNDPSQEHIRYQGKYYALDVPTPKWKKLNLLDNTQQQNFMNALRDKMQISHKTLMDMYDQNYEEELKRLEEEDNTYVDPAFHEAKKSQIGEKIVAEQVLKGTKSKDLKLVAKGKKEPVKTKAPKQMTLPGMPGGKEEVPGGGRKEEKPEEVGKEELPGEAPGEQVPEEAPE